MYDMRLKALLLETFVANENISKAAPHWNYFEFFLVYVLENSKNFLIALNFKAFSIPNKLHQPKVFCFK